MPDKRRHTILAVDDEEGILKSLRRLLADLDAEVLTATSGKKALDMLKSRDISLIISDQRMPEMTGVEFLQRSREVSP
jgi:CheY-like chemotaxis protein